MSTNGRCRLQSERKQWETLLAPSHDSAISPLSYSETPHPHTSISSLLINPPQSPPLHTLQSFFHRPPSASPQSSSTSIPDVTLLCSSVATRLDHVASTLEFTVDTLASNTHTLSSYRDTAEQAADRILDISAQALELRDEEGKAKEAEQAVGEESGNGSQTGIRDVLRGLSRILGQGKS